MFLEKALKRLQAYVHPFKDKHKSLNDIHT